MFFGQGFDLNGDGNNDIFIGRHFKQVPRTEKQRQSDSALFLIAFVVVPLLLLAVAGVGAIGVAIASGLTWCLLQASLIRQVDFQWVFAVIAVPSVLICEGVAFLGIYAQSGPGAKRRRRAKIKRKRDSEQPKPNAPPSTPRQSARPPVESPDVWVRRGKLTKGPVTAREVLNALQARQLVDSDEWAIQAAGPWLPLSTFVKLQEMN